MRAISTRFRRFVASVMLVAMASFGLHNGALAGMHRHGAGDTDCAGRHLHAHAHAHAPHESAAAGPVHNAGEPDRHRHGTSPELPDEAGEPGSAAADGSCCTGGCPVAVTAPLPPGVPLPFTAVLRQFPDSQAGAATTLDRLKRPPRTLRIA